MTTTTLNPMSAIALVDPYWLLSDDLAPDAYSAQMIHRAVEPRFRIRRIHWYEEADPGAARDHAPGRTPDVWLRHVNPGPIADGFELLRAIDQDLRSLCAGGAVDAVMMWSMDDRLALSLAACKAAGLYLVGLRTGESDAEDTSSQRMMTLFDEVIAMDFPAAGQASGGSRSADDGAFRAVAASAISKWMADSPEEARDSVADHLLQRHGVPRFVDARLLFLARESLGRDLTEPEKRTLRSMFRREFSGMAAEIPATA